MKIFKNVLIDLFILAGLGSVVFGVYLYGGAAPAFMVGGTMMSGLGLLYLRAPIEKDTP